MQTQEDNKLKTSGWGIDLNYKDALGEWHETQAETVAAIKAAMGADADSLTPALANQVLVIRSGEQRGIDTPGRITLENGEVLEVSTRLPADLPNGYHWLQAYGAKERCRLIVGPAQCWMPDHLQTWGWAVQLYAARSRESWGMGDLGDLESLAKWSAEMGAGMLLVNPLSASIPLPQQQPSPYYPSSRRFLNPIWLKIEWINGAEQIPGLQELAMAARLLNDDRTIDRNRVFELKMQALNALWLCFTGDDAFNDYCEAEGKDLEIYATYCALVEQHACGWHQWPEQFQHPANQAVAAFAAANRGRVDFHKWLQWLIDLQMARCSKHLALMQDLPIGVDPDGADSWAWQDVIAKGVAVGAPPDEFNTQGQNWGLPPYIPHKLREVAYEPFIQTVRAAMRNTGGLRVDHVMGLFRLFWIPQGMSGSRGAYVRYDYSDLLTILALESERAKAYVVGEDLGTVEDEMRSQLSSHHVLSYRLLWFEKEFPATFPREALAAVTTHDLPTVAGLWSGADLEKQKQLGLQPNEESTRQIHERLANMGDITPHEKMSEVVLKAYRLLAQAPSRILTAALDDAAQVEERPNLPATTLDTNWSIALPVPIEDLMTAELPRKIAEALRRSA